MNFKAIIEDFKFIEMVMKRKSAKTKVLLAEWEKINYVLVFVSTVPALYRKEILQFY